MARVGWIGAVLMIALGSPACDSGGGSGSPPRKMRIANPYQDKLVGLSVLNRSLGLRRAIQDAGEGCSRITASGHQGSFGDLPMWVGRCAPEGDYAIFIAPNGNAQVRACKDTVSLKLPECRTDSLQTVPRITGRPTGGE